MLCQAGTSLDELPDELRVLTRPPQEAGEAATKMAAEKREFQYIGSRTRKHAHAHTHAHAHERTHAHARAHTHAHALTHTHSLSHTHTHKHTHTHTKYL